MPAAARLATAAPARADPPLTGVARTLATLAGGAGLVVLIGWLLGIRALQRVAPGLVSMTFNAAVCLVLLGLAWWLPRAAGLVAAVVASLVALASLLEYAAEVDLHIDQLVVRNPDDVAHPGRMAVVTAGCVLLVAAGRVALLLDRPRPVQALAIGVLIVTAVAVLGYAYGVRALYSSGPFSTIALHTALALHLLGFALLADVRGGLLPWIVRGSDAGGVLLRRLLPVALLGLPLIGWLRLRGEEIGLYQSHLGLALMIVASAVLVSVVTWSAAQTLNRVDQGRLAAIESLRRLTAELEDRIAERVAQVEAHHARIAVLEDRERIAADLHDLVVQRLFAAGVQLQRTAGLADAQARQHSIDVAIDGIDAAIHDLRASILGLKSGRHYQDLAAEIDGILDTAQIVLGFRPTLEVSGPVEPAAAVGDDLLAVLREGLANVARHAHATSTRVALRVDPDRITLTIADDGVGIPARVVDSGRANLRMRAEQHGGRCVWRPHQPHGTVVEWSIPVPDGSGTRGAAAGTEVAGPCSLVGAEGTDAAWEEPTEVTS